MSDPNDASNDFLTMADYDRQPSTRKPGGSADPPVTAEPRTRLKPETLDMLERLWTEANRFGPGEELTAKEALEYQVAWGRLHDAATGYLPDLIRAARAEAAAPAASGLDIEQGAGAVDSDVGHPSENPVHPPSPDLELLALAIHRATDPDCVIPDCHGGVITRGLAARAAAEYARLHGQPTEGEVG